jgi:tRNA1Val (adenine37-N6)-methyltransferase
MTVKPFRFKQFDIYHDKCAMKVGTDGVLLGAWCTAKDASSALDIGTGSGLIAMMLAQRQPGCVIDAVEIDRESFLQASENAARSPWSGRIRVHHNSFQEFCRKPDHQYDLIVSNPPYFRNSLTNPDPRRTNARHSGSLTMDEIIEGVLKLLAGGGRFCMIMPAAESEIFIKNASGSGLWCRKITTVHPNPGKPSKRCLMEFRRIKGDIQTDELIIELDRRHEYSDEFRKLTGDFYLDFRY